MLVFKDIKKCIIPMDDSLENDLIIMLPLDKKSTILSDKEKQSKDKCYLGVEYSSKKEGIAYFVKCGKNRERHVYVKIKNRMYVNKMAMQGITCYYRKLLKK